MLSLILFAIAAMGGVALAAIRFSGRPYPPLPLALLHGTAAASGLIALVVAVAQGSAPDSAKFVLGLFLVAAAGGFFSFSKHLRKIPLPIWLVVVHGLAAVTAFLILLVGLTF